MKHMTILAAAAALLCAVSCNNQPAETTMNKDFLTLATERYSVRHFTDTPVEQEKVEKIIEAGRVAPTAVNSQPQMIYVVSNPDAIAKLNEVSPCLYGAPQCIVACYNDATVCKRGDKGNYGDIDVTIVLTHMMLQAAELGVGTCLVGMYDEAALISALELPEGIHPVLLMPFGYAAEDAVPSPKHTEYRPQEETVKFI